MQISQLQQLVLEVSEAPLVFDLSHLVLLELNVGHDELVPQRLRRLVDVKVVADGHDPAEDASRRESRLLHLLSADLPSVDQSLQALHCLWRNLCRVNLGHPMDDVSVPEQFRTDCSFPIALDGLVVGVLGRDERRLDL